MLKQNKSKLIVSSLIIFLPTLFGAVLWNRLPAQIVTRFSWDGSADNWSGKPFVVFGLPTIFFAVHVFCIFCTLSDSKSRGIGGKLINLLFWIIPSVSLIIMSALYAISLGISIDLRFLCTLLIAILYLILGNLLPKSRQNYTVGLKFPWTLHNQENWNHTHRFAAWCMVISSAVLVMSASFQVYWLVFVTLLTNTALPFVYSYLFYRCNMQKEK